MKVMSTLICLVHLVNAYTNIPVIGILTQESAVMDQFFPEEKYHSFIASSYVKFVESAGARAVPIWIGQKEDYYKKIVQSTNGLLLPGGAANFFSKNGYADAGQILYNLALGLNQNGSYYPVWGTCLGMELLANLAAGGKDLRTRCFSVNIPLALEFKPDFRASKLFKNAPEKIIKNLETKKLAFNNHVYCITEQSFISAGLKKDWRIVATNKNNFGSDFISIFESKRYPFYTVQFHPEKNQYEFLSSLNIPRSREAVEIAQYFANFFVDETRKNNHGFVDWETEQRALIYNYPTHFTGLQNSSFQQVFMFKESDYLNFL